MTDKVGGIDIIIPIYNAYEDLVKCILSIWKHTDLDKNRLILVNDKSPDTRIEPYLSSIAGKNIIIHNSAENGGFSASVNIGMHYSEENDVILLNSDTLVTEGWLDKIRECAYSEETIGTVTPLSNSATLASIPVFGQDNPLPPNVNVDEMGQLVERCSFKSYPQITVAVGFCMFIKRKLIEEIGFFDAETFGRGYGEENDFCCRAELMGYKHVLCDNTFVYHKGTASFQSEQKKALAEAHVKILEERYPAGMRNNHIFCMSNPYQYIRDNIMMYLKFYNKKKNILYVLHEDFREGAGNSVGGTQLHVKDLTNNLKKQYNVFVLAKEEKGFRISCYIDEKVYAFQFENDNVNIYPVFRDRGQYNLFRNILSAFRIDMVHIHHVANISLEIYYAAYELGIPLTTTIHDFYMLCPTYFLFDRKNKFCGAKICGNCGECLLKRMGIYDGERYIRKWREEMQAALQLNNVLVFPSQSAKSVFESTYSIEAPKYVIGHGVAISEEKQSYRLKNGGDDFAQCNVENIDLANGNIVEGWAFKKGQDNKEIGVLVQLVREGQVIQEVKARKQTRIDVDNAFAGNGQYTFSGFTARIAKEGLQEGKVVVRILLIEKEEAYVVEKVDNISLQHERIGNGIRVAFIGGLSDVKGSAVAYDLVTRGTDVEWFVFGDISREEKMAGVELPNLHKFGGYARKDIVNLLQQNKIDIVCILSQCSETFCYTLSEAWQACIPVIGFDIGAVGERIKEVGAGITIPINEGADAIISKIKLFHSDDEWKRAKEVLREYSHKSVEQMVQEYEQMYEKLMLQPVKQEAEFDTRLIFEAALKS